MKITLDDIETLPIGHIINLTVDEKHEIYDYQKNLIMKTKNPSSYKFEVTLKYKVQKKWKVEQLPLQKTGN